MVSFPPANANRRFPPFEESGAYGAGLAVSGGEFVATMRSRRLRSYTVVSSPVGRGSGQPWFARFLIGLVALAVLVGLVGIFGQWALGEGLFEGVDAFTIEADPDRWLTTFFVAITWLGTMTGFVVVSSIMFLVLLLLKRYRGAAAFLLSLLTAAYTNDFLKEWVARERPVHAGIVEAGGFSYLSGHAFVSAAAYGLFAYLLVKKVESAGLRWFLGTIAIVLIGLIGFSRIYLGVHYTSDVIGGYLLGIVWMAVWLGVFRPFGAKSDRW